MSEVAEERAAEELAALAKTPDGTLSVSRYRWENPRFGYALLRARGYVELAGEGAQAVSVRITDAGRATQDVG